MFTPTRFTKFKNEFQFSLCFTNLLCFGFDKSSSVFEMGASFQEWTPSKKLASIIFSAETSSEGSRFLLTRSWWTFVVWIWRAKHHHKEWKGDAQAEYFARVLWEQRRLRTLSDGNEEQLDVPAMRRPLLQPWPHPARPTQHVRPVLAHVPTGALLKRKYGTQNLIRIVSFIKM